MTPVHQLSLRHPFRLVLLPAALAALLAFGQAGGAVDSVQFDVPGADGATVQALKSASALLSQGKISQRSAQDLYADARAEYGRLIDALYALGYYGPVIHVRLNGKEAADIAPLDAPASIDRVSVEVETGPQFLFATTQIAPLARGTDLPPDFRPGAIAASTTIQTAVTLAIDGWRAQGNAKAAVASQSVVADHDTSTLSADVTLTPGPVLRFGPLTVTGADRMRVARIVKIAGLTPGLRYSSEALNRAADRLRRSGVFSSVTLTEDTAVTPPDTLGITAQVVEARLHRYSFGAEVSSLDGAKLTGSWLHRDLFGGGERLTITGEIANIGAQSSGMDYDLGATLDLPAAFGPDTSGSLLAKLGHQDQVDYTDDTFDTGITFTHWFDKHLTANVGLTYSYSQGHDDTGDFFFRALNLPIGATWDNRNSVTDATKGFYLDATAKPFLGFGTTDDGAQITFDARGYKTVGSSGLTFAGRLQGGAVLAANVLRTPREDLFYSGGGGTVRGQPYQSLSAQTLSGGTLVDIGGTTYLGGSLEGRVRINDNWGAVGFVDAGLVDIGTFAASDTNWQAGAGIGIRYQTGFGPIRLDLALPVHGDTSNGLQIYVGLGQAF
jgi:translocation and assembly module TamA